jgi:transporter family-2 protein
MSMTVAALLVAAILVGALPPLQAGINASLAQHFPSPVYAALTNTLVASAVLAAALPAIRGPAPSLANAAAVPWWGWTGGVIGATLVLSAILIAPRLGAAGFVSAMIVGTMAASLIIDHFGLVGFAARPVDGVRVLGGALVVAGMLIIQAR